MKSELLNKHKPLAPKQRDFIRDLGNPDIEEMDEDGGARSGKSWAICTGIALRALKYPGSRHLVARYRRSHLEKTLWMQTLLPILRLTFPNGGFTEDKQKLIITFPNGSTIWGEGLDTKERVEKVMGSEYITVFLNEATQLTYNTYQSLLTRLSQVVYSDDGKVCPAKMIVDCNPRNKHHWIYRYFHLKMDPESRQSVPLPAETVKVISQRKWTPADNPYLSESYRKKLSRLTGTANDRLNKGDWVNQEGLVYPSFDECVVDPFQIPKEWPVFSSVDFGFTNPFVYLWLAYDQSNETYYLFDEIYESQKIVEDHAKEIHRRQQEYGRPRWVVADHDAEDRATLSRHGIETEKANKDVSAGIQAVTGMLRSGPGTKLRIFRTCVHTIEEGATYSWEEGKSKEAPKKEMDHAMDALRYFAMKAAVPELQWGFTRAS